MAETSNAVTSAAQVSSIERGVLSLIWPREADGPLPADEISHSFFEGEVPQFLGPDLERLYQSLYSTLERLRIYEQDKNVSAYVERRGDKVISAILFRLENNKVVVLNQQTTLKSIEISKFSNAVFFRYKSVKLISYWGLISTPPEIPYATRRNYCLPEVVVVLPESPDSYLSSLGKSTRRSIRSSLKKVAATFPSFSVERSVKSEIRPSDIFDIINLNNARMANKDKVTYNSDEETQRLIRLANVYGLVLTLKIDGRVCAGAVGYCVGSTCFFHTLAHDPKLDELKLGMVCCYLMLCECIARGVREVRFGGSSHRYKFDFKGNLLRMDYLLIYRNFGHYVLHAASSIPTSFEAYLGRAKLWLLLAERREDFASRLIARGINRLRELRRFRISL